MAADAYIAMKSIAIFVANPIAERPNTTRKVHRGARPTAHATGFRYHGKTFGSPTHVVPSWYNHHSESPGYR